jgi:Ulp1 family protease
LKKWIYSHSIQTLKPAGSLAIVPETIVSAEVSLRSIATLEDGRWIDSEILNCYFVQHALCTGGCCSQFPQPIPRCEPHVFYSDTYFIPHFVVEKRKWNHNIFDYAFMVITAFINRNHYVSFLANIATHHLLSFDSMGHTQDHIRDQLRLWLENESQGQSWTTEASDCPQQDNMDDCALFALMAGTYSHLDRPLAHCYSQNDMASARNALVQFAVAVGNRFREGSAWTPFQNVED